MSNDVVLDFTAQFDFPVIGAKEKDLHVLRHPGIPLVANPRSPVARSRPLDASFPVFYQFDQALFPFASSLTLLPGAQPADVRLFAVATTTAESAVDLRLQQDLAFSTRWKPRPPLTPRIVAAVALGKLVSAFRSRRSAEVPLQFLTAKSPSRVQIASLYTKHLTGMILSFKNTLDWLTNDSDLIEVSARLGKTSREQ